MLTIDDGVWARVASALRWAERPENHYNPRDLLLPREVPQEAVVDVDGFRCIFTHTHSSEALVFRHLSVMHGTRPNPAGLHPPLEAVHVLARMFGFTGSPAYWTIARHERFPVTAVMQTLDAIKLGIEVRVVEPQSRDPFVCWVVYDKPSDFPTKYVVREWRDLEAQSEHYLFDCLEEAREFIKENNPLRSLVPIPRLRADDAKIVETWV